MRLRLFLSHPLIISEVDRNFLFVLAVNPSLFSLVFARYHPGVNVSHSKRKGQLPGNRDKAIKTAKQFEVKKNSPFKSTKSSPGCFVSNEFGQLIVFPELWFEYNETKQGDMHEYQKENIT